MRPALNAREIAIVVGLHVRTIQHRATSESWTAQPRQGRGGGREYPIATLPEDIRRAVLAHEVKAQSPDLVPAGCQDQARVVGLMEEWEGSPEWSRRRAEARHLILQAVDKLEESGVSRGHAETLFAKLYGTNKLELAAWVREEERAVSPATIRRWRAAFKQDGLAGLLSRHGASRGSRRSTPPEVRVFLVAHLQERPHIKASTLCEIARSKFSGKCPSDRTIYRVIDDFKREHEELYCLLDDPRRWKSKFLPSFGSKAADVPYAGHTWEMDSTPADVMTADGKRCCIIGAIDIYSRRMRLLVADSGRAVTVAACMRRAMLDFGIPTRIRMDNGKDYQSRHVTAILTALNVERIWCRPYHGEEKPFIERALQTYTHGLHELLPAYTGHSVSERQALRERKTWASKIMEPGDPVAIPLTMDELQDVTDRWLKRYESTAHDGLNGRTPVEIAKASSRQPAKIHGDDERVLDILLAPVATPVVGKKGIRLDGLNYTAIELLDYIGARVEARRDLEDAGRIYVFRDGKFLCTAKDEAMTGVLLEDYIQAKKAKERSIKAQAKALQTLSQTIEDPVSILLPTGEKLPTPSDKVVNFQAKADGPALREARKAFVEPESPKGEAQELGAEPLPHNVVRGDFPRQETNAAYGRPLFNNAIEAFDWLCAKEAEQGYLGPDDRKWKMQLIDNYREIQDILELRRQAQAHETMKKF